MSWIKRISQKKPMALPKRETVPHLDVPIENTHIPIGGRSIDYRMTPEVALSEEELHPDIEYIGQGNFGVAYSIGNRVVKYTGDKDEARVALHVYKDPLPCVARIFDEPKMVQREPPVWKIVFEKIKPLSRMEQSIVHIIFPHYSSPPTFEDIDDFVSEHPELTNEALNLEKDYFDLVECLQFHGYRPDDTHAGNLGYNAGGNLVIFDVGGML